AVAGIDPLVVVGGLVLALAGMEAHVPRISDRHGQARAGDLLRVAAVILETAVVLDITGGAQKIDRQLHAIVPAITAIEQAVVGAIAIAVRLVGEAAGEHRARADTTAVDAVGVLG